MATASRRATGRSSRAVFMGAVGALVLLFGVAIALTRSDPASESQPGALEETRPVSVEGIGLPPYEVGTDDPAIGAPAPRVEGSDFSGAPQTLVEPGVPTAIVFLAHWCPHCQAEVPVVQEWLDAGGLPEGVRLMTVVTGTDPTLPNYPPSAWLAGEGWTSPVLVDDAGSTVGDAFGLTGTPFWVFVDADGEVVSRVSGELPVGSLDELIAGLAR